MTVATRSRHGWSVAAPCPARRACHPAEPAEPEGGTVALGVDFPFGLPRAMPPTLPSPDFPSFLRGLADRPGFFTVCDDAGRDRARTGLSTHAAAGRHDPAVPRRRARAGRCRRAVPAVRPGHGGAAGRGTAVLDARRQPVRQGRDLRLAGSSAPRAADPARRRCGHSMARSCRCCGRAGSPSRRPTRRRRCASSGCAWGQQAAPGRPRPLGGGLHRGRHGRAAATPAQPWHARCPPGFGAEAAGEDRFDSVLGLLCLLAVLAGRRPDTAPPDPWIQRWEGWVLGQTPPAALGV